MPATRLSGVVRGGSTVLAIWIWLLHKQEVSGSWNWLLHKQEVSGVWISGAPTIAAYSRRRLTGLVWTGGIAVGC